MEPPEDGPSNRGRRRLHHACRNCRRKKTRCPGEKPACSSCVRLKQACSYPPAPRLSQSGRSEERLAHLEEKLDLILSGSLTNQQQQQQQKQQNARHEPVFEENAETSEKSYSATPPQAELNLSHQASTSHPPPIMISDPERQNLRPSRLDIETALDLYFKFCHRQPVWCFEHDEVSNYGTIPEDLVCSILALTSRFSEKRDQMQIWRKNAKRLIMFRIANGSVELTTIEALCLLSYSSFMDGNIQLGQFHLGLAFQLCRSAMLDVQSVYAIPDQTTERKKRVFWSLQLLEQFYGRQDGILNVSTEIWRPTYSSMGKGHLEFDAKAPPLPRDELGTTGPSEPGIWNTSLYLGWVWSQVRRYVSNCANDIVKEPWRHDSMYAKVLSDFLETENRIPMCHRYDSAKFFERKVEELKMNRDYWAPWLKEQFTYHIIPTVLNHPFLYIVGAQHNPNLAIPNTFWRRSSELALIHATWIVRMIDMAVDKQVPLVDPFFGHVAAVAATVHLYYCCAAAARLKHKSNTDFAKCRRFLKTFLPVSAGCAALDRALDKMTRIAAGSESIDVEDWMPSRIYLSVPLMWKILQFDFMTDLQDVPPVNLLDSSLTPTATQEDNGENSTLEIIVATSPEITINTADGGQEAPTLSYKAPMTSTPASTRSTVCNNEMTVEQADSLTFNTTPGLYADDSWQFLNIGDMGYLNAQPVINEQRGIAWWEGENLTNIMFNNF